MATGLDICGKFREIVNTDHNLSMPVATIKALSETLKQSQASTVSGFIEDLGRIKAELIQHTHQAVSILAGCELFGRYVTRVASDELNFEDFKDKLLARAEAFPETAENCKKIAAKNGLQFIKDGQAILIHSFSKVVMELLALAVRTHKRRFKVYCTEARPSSSAARVKRLLETELGVPCHVILDSAVGYYMERMDVVLFGAEGVVENGGIINQIGTYQISILAKNANVPVYAMAETYKFVRLFPLNQFDLPSSTSSSFELVESARSSMASPHDDNVSQPSILSPANPMVDYTPPSYIDLLFTDLGVLTPSGVSDELIKFYY